MKKLLITVLIIAEDSRADTSNLMIHPTEKIVQAVRAYRR
jgi:hypothetical protein